MTETADILFPIYDMLYIQIFLLLSYFELRGVVDLTVDAYTQECGFASGKSHCFNVCVCVCVCVCVRVFYYYYYSANSTIILCLSTQILFFTSYDAQASSACSALFFLYVTAMPLWHD